MEIIMLDVIDNPIVQGWMQNIIRFNPTGFARLVGDNTTRLQKIYGSPSGIDKGVSYWVVTRNGLNFIVLTGSQGTVVRIKMPNKKVFFEDYKVANGINNFLEDLMDMLTGNKTFIAN